MQTGQAAFHKGRRWGWAWREQAAHSFGPQQLHPNWLRHLRADPLYICHQMMMKMVISHFSHFTTCMWWWGNLPCSHGTQNKKNKEHWSPQGVRSEEKGPTRSRESGWLAPDPLFWIDGKRGDRTHGNDKGHTVERRVPRPGGKELWRTNLTTLVYPHWKCNQNSPTASWLCN